MPPYIYQFSVVVQKMIFFLEFKITHENIRKLQENYKKITRKLQENLKNLNFQNEKFINN